ncbi:transporter fucose permease [Bifidobacterium dolichotidis]|uniref:Transporter fucose permease n=1 Tax=Bifidobacterium dolichotidis TaxID=2306976 RepID=A0A430FSE2_9BIFI|nr:MFS transporter [Bifidobacterium dolichotidis]RSX55785.1 transporter fucose permease [Bifidobacterium dolichotidis]
MTRNPQTRTRIERSRIRKERFLVVLIAIAYFAMGLPVALLGASWPAMGKGLGGNFIGLVGIAMMTCVASTIASLSAQWLRTIMSIGFIVLCNILLAAMGCMAFALVTDVSWLLVFAIPYGWAAGTLTSTLNSYVAARYSSQAINWFHSTKLAGTTIGHAALGIIIAIAIGWRDAYGFVGLMLIACALPCAAVGLWRYGRDARDIQGTLVDKDPELDNRHVLTAAATLSAVRHLPKVLFLAIMVLGYTSVQQTMMLWGSTYMVEAEGMTIEYSGWYASLFFVGMTVGLVIAGFAAKILDGPQRIHIGEVMMVAALILMLLPIHAHWKAVVVPILLGLGVAPINPAVIAMIPHWYGVASTRTVVSLITAMTAIGVFATPALFSILARMISIHTLPWYLLLFAVVTIVAGEVMMARHRVDQLPAVEAAQ